MYQVPRDFFLGKAMCVFFYDNNKAKHGNYIYTYDCSVLILNTSEIMNSMVKLEKVP